MTQPVQIWTDGACRGNPGPGGWGVVLRFAEAELRCWGGEPATTNNRMELTAALRALQRLKRPCEVEVWTDSRYLIFGMQEGLAKWQRNQWRTASRQPVKNQQLWQELAQRAATHQINWHWVRGHDGDAGNELADALANRGVDEFALAGRCGADEEMVS